ncbi:septation protein SepH [Klugiella xanthotipulae]|uniref:DUF3071 family protein n=1 Tax=Klugiella xanthotipulae TaxID=244735 RepID=A0A543HSC1_9MICO|nr:septation protein SepH [Klugiella xanthotipulae]TQM61169.1 DUF3071 family protein [Klugiella xanthotipulae]
MQELRVVGIEDGYLIVSNDAGESFRVLADESLFSEVRRLTKRDTDQVRVSPRIIQSHIRSGHTREEISTLTGASTEDIEKYEGPVLAEREYILSSALAVSVVLNTSQAEMQQLRFGDALSIRLDTLSASERIWTCWRDEDSGWLIQLAFVANDISHQAVWAFDNKRSALTPINSDAITLSKQGDISDRLIPKLRAVEPTEPRLHSDRFDSGAFDPNSLTAATTPDHTESTENPGEDLPQESYWSREVDELAVSRADDHTDFGQTADLLEALRRRRGERESAAAQAQSDSSSVEKQDAESSATTTPLFSANEVPPIDATEQVITRGSRSSHPEHPSSGIIPAENEDAHGNESAPAATTPRGRKKRAEMPSWDDILFGGPRNDDDPV